MILQKQLDEANARGVGQFHIYEGGQVTGTWRTFTGACWVADRRRTENNRKAEVYNDSGEKVYEAR